MAKSPSKATALAGGGKSGGVDRFASSGDIAVISDNVADLADVQFEQLAGDAFSG